VVKHPGHVRPCHRTRGPVRGGRRKLTGFENLRMVGFLNHMEKSTAVARSRELLAEFGLRRIRAQIDHDLLRGHATTPGPGGRPRRRSPILSWTNQRPASDPQSRQDLWAIIEGLVEGGTTVLLTTQYLEEADRLCKQLVVLDHGKIIAEGTSSPTKEFPRYTVLVLTFSTTGDAQRALGLISDISAKPANVDGTVIEVDGRQRTGRCRRSPSTHRQRRHHDRRTTTARAEPR